MQSGIYDFSNKNWHVICYILGHVPFAKREVVSFNFFMEASRIQFCHVLHPASMHCRVTQIDKQEYCAGFIKNSASIKSKDKMSSEHLKVTKSTIWMNITMIYPECPIACRSWFLFLCVQTLWRSHSRVCRLPTYKKAYETLPLLLLF